MQEGEKPAVPTPAPQPQQAPVVFENNIAASTPAPSPAPPVEKVLDGITWTASEFVAHTKTGGWYAILGGGAVVVAAVIYLLTKDMVTSGMVVIVAILFGIMAARKPRELSYVVNEEGVHVGDKFYPYANFKSFSVIQEEGLESIWFMPLQRFMPGLSIYFAPTDGDRIVEALADFLPFEPRKIDPIDKLMHKIRF